MLRRQKHALSQSTTPFACSLLWADVRVKNFGHSLRNLENKQAYAADIHVPKAQMSAVEGRFRRTPVR